ncbi:hypothetical protein PuT2_12005 [Pusillimonas sp. T2]|uniref:thioredoxin fold domain-containing protein n=1 Tax=Pusillimonas sp. T2 TaxID=1548123 RepID=UPI000B9CE266|nr:thioredoxin fold domain-containing protein [Pusillimonas sp. T2]OXR48684.1 hypothetical protein PuT2_12005 [Pusillimonas sp. T2]
MTKVEQTRILGPRVKRWFSTFIVGLAFLPSMAKSDADPQSPPANVAALLVEKEDHVVRTFAVREGLTGWVVQKGGQQLVVYTLAPDDWMLVGSLYDNPDNDLTLSYLRQYTNRFDDAADQKLPAALEASEVFDTLKTLTSVVQPKVKPGQQAQAPHAVYILVDMQCPYCHLLWQVLEPTMRAGQAIHWVPVAFLGQDSWEQGAQVLAGQDSYALMSAFMNGSTPASSDHPAHTERYDTAKLQIEQANRLMVGAGLSGTPAMIWKDAQGQIRLAQGIASVSELESILGVPLKPLAPELQKRLDTVLKGR